MSHPLDEVLQAQKRGEAVGIPSICSAHPGVLKTALHGAGPVLIESTCNQVNQLGGYTGMTPADFVHFVRKIADGNGFPPEKVLLGGDHLGPSPWQNEPEDRAMQKAVDMIQAYVQAGFTKLHLDASMRLADDDPAHPLDLELAARRTAILARAAEATLAKVAGSSQGLRYVIGTEVPIPGGATEHEDRVGVTTVEDTRRTLEVTRAAFTASGLEPAWERVLALVVQPGVEFGDDFVFEYNPEAARELARFSETLPFLYEAHSTDYQTRPDLQNLVRDHFAILKVGPALTFAFREAVFALAKMEDEFTSQELRSNLIETVDTAMLRTPHHWENHYHGTSQEQAFKRKYSLSDRVRYYWPDPAVRAAFKKMMTNLGKRPLPLTLLGQFLPDLLPGIRAGSIPNTASGLIFARINSALANYNFACMRPGS